MVQRVDVTCQDKVRSSRVTLATILPVWRWWYGPAFGGGHWARPDDLEVRSRIYHYETRASPLESMRSSRDSFILLGSEKSSMNLFGLI